MRRRQSPLSQPQILRGFATLNPTSDALRNKVETSTMGQRMRLNAQIREEGPQLNHLAVMEVFVRIVEIGSSAQARYWPT
jgi:hypothetical protein